MAKSKTERIVGISSFVLGGILVVILLPFIFQNLAAPTINIKSAVVTSVLLIFAIAAFVVGIYLAKD